MLSVLLAALLVQQPAPRPQPAQSHHCIVLRGIKVTGKASLAGVLRMFLNSKGEVY
jgi:hypothetical protein